jgi:aminoglycoside 6'-N-acetyltransferase I
MPITISPVRCDQFDQWRRLREAVYSGIDGTFHEQEMQSFYRDDTKLCLLACDDAGMARGMAELSLRNIVDGCLTSPVGYLEGIYVDPLYRDSGVARQLMQHAEEWVRAQGCREFATDAELDNHAAQRFHQHMGFQETYRVVEFRKQL